jgi:5-methylcytosine-specific restriction endonuclease McrA
MEIHPKGQNEMNKSDIGRPNPSKSDISPSDISRPDINRAVWKKANAKCEFPGCNSQYQLQIDHIKPKTLGGTNAPENLRLLCRVHNVQQAFQKLGPNIMKKYVPSLR